MSLVHSLNSFVSKWPSVEVVGNLHRGQRDSFLPFFRHQPTPASTRGHSSGYDQHHISETSLHTWLPLLSLEGQGKQPGCDLYRDFFAHGPQAQRACGKNTSHMIFVQLCTKWWANLFSPSPASKLLETSLFLNARKKGARGALLVSLPFMHRVQVF